MSITKIFAVLISVILLFSFTIHAVDFFHSHPHGLFGSGIEEVLHSMDRKLMFIIALILIAWSIAHTFLFREREKISISAFFLKRFKYESKNPIREALRKGVIHPKLCG